MTSDIFILDIAKNGLNVILNPFVPNAPFLYLLKTLGNRKAFWCFQGVDKGCIGNEWVDNAVMCNTPICTIVNRGGIVIVNSEIEKLLTKGVIVKAPLDWQGYPFSAGVH